MVMYWSGTKLGAKQRCMAPLHRRGGGENTIEQYKFTSEIESGGRLGGQIIFSSYSKSQHLRPPDFTETLWKRLVEGKHQTPVLSMSLSSDNIHATSDLEMASWLPGLKNSLKPTRGFYQLHKTWPQSNLSFAFAMKAGEAFVIFDNSQHKPHRNEKEDKLSGEDVVPLAYPLMKWSQMKLAMCVALGWRNKNQ